MDYNFALPGVGLKNKHQSVNGILIKARRSIELYCIHMLFFISLSAAITSTSFVLPVALCTVGSWNTISMALFSALDRDGSHRLA